MFNYHQQLVIKRLFQGLCAFHHRRNIFFCFRKEQITNKNSFSGRFASAMQFLTFNVGAKTFIFFISYSIVYATSYSNVRLGVPSLQITVKWLFCILCYLCAYCGLRIMYKICMGIAYRLFFLRSIAQFFAQIYWNCIVSS